MYKNIKNLIVSSTIFSLFAINIVFAADLPPRGPQGTIGNQGQVGVQPVGDSATVVGPNVPTGTQGSTGPQVTTGPTTPTGPQTQSNTNTGPNSDNSNSQNTNNSTDISTTNSANINNNVNIDTNSGKNNVGSNTQVGNVQTGSINGQITLVNLGNSTLDEGSTVSASLLNGTAMSSFIPQVADNAMLLNSTTGPNSNNSNSSTNNNIIKVYSANDAAANNNINVVANTGENQLTSNTLLGGLSTGNINLGINLINLLNLYNPGLQLSLNTWSLLGGLNGDIIVPGLTNSTTGSNSLNTNQLSSTSDINNNLTNNATVAGVFNVNTNTGNNTVNNNSTVGTVTTGSSTLQDNITNILNSPLSTLYLVNVFGNWTGTLAGLDPNQFVINLVGSNNQTGANSNNTNTLATNSSIDSTTINNASADNKININANTGNNTLAQNTSVGGISTGDINIYGNILNILNSFGDGAHAFSLNIINILGDWNGNGTNKLPEPTGIANTTPSILDPKSATASAVNSGATNSSSLTINEQAIPNSSKTTTQRKSKTTTASNNQPSSDNNSNSQTLIASASEYNDSNSGIDIQGYNSDPTQNSDTNNSTLYTVIGLIVGTTFAGLGYVEIISRKNK